LRYLNQWIEQLRWQRLEPFKKLAETLLSHLEGILNYCRVLLFGVTLPAIAAAALAICLCPAAHH